MNILRDSQIILFGTTLLLLSGCQLEPNLAQHAQPSPMRTETWLNSVSGQQHLQNAETAHLALNDAFISIAARLHLIHQAKHSLDLQYYIWKNDSIGQLMLAELLKAADRGVKVRLLIDDQNGTQLDARLKALSQHPNFEIKLFNPYKYRQFRLMDYLFRFSAINHRMHNKLLIADGSIAITGGRNISREYFDASEHFQFTDMDILFAGTAVNAANQSFIDFWNHQLSYAIPQLLGTADADDLKAVRLLYAQSTLFPQGATDQKIKQAQQQIAQSLKERPIQWATAHFLADSPDKIQGKANADQLLYRQMIRLMGKPQRHMELVSAYFVPTVKGADYLSQLAEHQVKVRILTNSLQANDVAVVHAFYQQYRQQLLRHGVEVYEFKPYIDRKRRTWYESMTGNVIPAKGKNASSLHAKFFDVDGKVFIGSFNFDPRSFHLNTEVGLVVESSELQQQIQGMLDQYLPRIAYQLKLDAQGNIIWLDQRDNGEIWQYQQEPESTSFQRGMIKMVSYLPIEWMM